MGEVLTSAETIYGDTHDYTLGCNPEVGEENGYLGDDYCVGNFKETTLKREITQECKKIWKSSFYTKIKMFYKIILLLYIFLWIIIKVNESTTMKIILLIVIVIMVYLKVLYFCDKHSGASYCINMFGSKKDNPVSSVTPGDCDFRILPEECKDGRWDKTCDKDLKKPMPDANEKAVVCGGKNPPSFCNSSADYWNNKSDHDKYVNSMVKGSADMRGSLSTSAVNTYLPSWDSWL